jgi:hypothetical protein
VPDEATGAVGPVGTLAAGGADGTVVGPDGIAAVAGIEVAAGTAAADGLATGLAAGAIAGLAAEAAGTLGKAGVSGAPVGALAGSEIDDADVASANAAFVRRNNARMAAAHADAIFHPLLREPPRAFMLHNPFFVA